MLTDLTGGKVYFMDLIEIVAFVFVIILVFFLIEIRADQKVEARLKELEEREEK